MTVSTSSSYVPQALTWGLIGVGAAAVAPMVGMGDWAGWIGAGGILVAGSVGVFGHRDQERRGLHLSLEEGLVPLIGPRATVVTRGWRGWPGTPGKVVIRYDATAKDGDPTWKQGVLDVTQRRLDVSASILGHDRRTRRVVLVTRAMLERLAQETPAPQGS